MPAIADRPYTLGVVLSPHPHAEMHLQTLGVLADVESIHLCLLEGADVESFTGGSSKIRSASNTVAQLLAREDVDALIVCVRNDLCPAILEAAVSAGKPVLFEKPGALRADDLRRIADRARARNLPMGTMFQWRGQPVIQEVRRAVQQGALGRVMAVEARLVTSQVRYRDPSHWLFKKENAGSGILSWLACHWLDVLTYVLGERIVDVVGMTGQQNPELIEVEDTACFAFRTERGVLGSYHAGYLLTPSKYGYSGGASDNFIALRGTEGSVRLPLSEGMAYTLVSGAPGWDAGGRRTVSFDLPSSPAYGGRPGELFVEEFLRAARTGNRPLAPIEAAVHVLEIVEAVIESSATGRLVAVAAGDTAT